MKILTSIEEIIDPRMIGKVQHNLSTIIFVALCGILSGCDDWKDIRDYCKITENYPKIHTAAPDIEIMFSIVSLEGLCSSKNRSTLYFDNRALIPCRI